MPRRNARTIWRHEGDAIVTQRSGSEYLVENLTDRLVDERGFEPPTPALRTRFMLFEIKGLRAKSFPLFSHTVTRGQARTPKEKPN